MMTSTPPPSTSRARRIAFWVALALASLFLVIALFPAYRLIVINWLPRELWLAVRTDHLAGEEVHRLHSLALSLLAWVMLLGLVSQVRRPVRKVAALLASLAVPVAIAVSEMLAGTYTVGGTAPFFVLLLLVIVLHPAAREVVRRPEWDLAMLGLVVVAAVPWVAYAVSMGEAAHHVAPGFELNHMTFMGAIALATPLWGAIGASKHAGWQYPAGACVVATACVGLQSAIYTDALSAPSPPWAAAALGWCVAYGSLAIRRTRG